MFKSVLILLLLSTSTFYTNSLYTDNVNDVHAVSSEQPTQEMYDFSTKQDSLNDQKLNYLDQFSSTVFTMSQSTPLLKNITNESILYSDINRLSKISDNLIKLLGPNKLNLNFKSQRELTELQALFQETVYKLYVISPYMPFLLSNEFEKTSYNINYITRINEQFNSNVKRMAAVQDQLNLGQHSSLPFNPKTPSQLSFALENQLNSSIMNMFGSTTPQSDMPFSAISTPANADVMNQTNAFQAFPAVPSGNGSPLQMMNYIPQF